MAEMKMAEIQAKVKAEVFKEIKNHFEENGEQFADFSIAVPVEVNGNEYWAKVVVTCGQIKDTKTTVAFNPFDVAEEWKADKEYKKQLAESKAKAKADKLARSKSKSKS
jgi:ligand-binding sensor protein